MNKPKPASKRQNQKQATRQKIRNSAQQLFTEQGYEATTSRQIAQQAGVALGTIFTHFKDKQAILSDILFEAIEQTVQDAFKTLNPNQHPQKQLMHLATKLYTYYANNLNLSRTLLKDNLLNPNTSTQFKQQIQHFITAINSIIQKGQTQNQINPNKNPKILAQTFMSLYFYTLMTLINEEHNLTQALEFLDAHLTELLL